MEDPTSLIPLFLATTAFFAVLSAYLLILLRNRSDAKRKDAEYAALLEQATDAIFLFKQDGTTLLANRRAESLLEATRDALVGRDICTYLAPASQTVLRDTLAAARRQPDGYFELESELTRADGRTLFVEASGRLVDQGRVLAVVRDQTQRKEFERANAELATRLVERQRMESLGKLAGGVAHDFNNLMTVVLANADEAAARESADPALRLNLTKIVTAAQRAGELTQQLLAYSGQSAFRRAKVDVNELVTELGGLLRSAIPVSVNLTSELEPDLPLIEGDAGRLRQVVMNLVLNAADAIPDSGSIVMRTRRVPHDELVAAQEREGIEPDERDQDGVLIEVIDDGTGMTSEIQDQIFDPFFTTKATGRGLGLAACQGIVRGHRGTLSVQSTWGEGSTFQIRLPGRSVVAEDTAVPAPRPTKSSSGLVLVIDDNADVRDSTAAMLRRFGYDVLVADGGERGLEEARRGGDAIGCALVDLSMPGMDGHATTDALRQLRPDLPVILMSGFAADAEATRHAGNTFTLQKPFTPDALRDRVERALEA
ncbi:MAG: ATP-binding protein [Planctomycetota bacterium]